MTSILNQKGPGQPCVVYLPGIEGSGRFGLVYRTGGKSLDRFAPALPRTSEADLGGDGRWLRGRTGRAGAVACSLVRRFLRQRTGPHDRLRHPHAASAVVVAGGFSKAPNPTRLLLAARFWDTSPKEVAAELPPTKTLPTRKKTSLQILQTEHRGLLSPMASSIS